MKIVILFVFLVILFGFKYMPFLTYILTFSWAIYLIYFSCKLFSVKDKKISTNNYIETPPNNNYSPYIRYLYSGKIDYKVFLLIVIELIKKESISIKYENRLYCLIDNKIEDEVLSNSEKYVKKLLFKDIGSKEFVVLNEMINRCNFNSGYLYEVYKEWVDIFYCDVSSNKYFKSNKKILDNSTNFLVMSFVISLLNIFFTRKVIISLIVFSIAAIICKYINDISNREEESKKEYIKWLEFKNYINKKDIEFNLDNNLLEEYALYSYALDSYNEFKNILSKYDEFDGEILNIFSNNIINDIDYIFKKSIGKLGINAIILLKSNKGRR